MIPLGLMQVSLFDDQSVQRPMVSWAIQTDTAPFGMGAPGAVASYIEPVPQAVKKQVITARKTFATFLFMFLPMNEGWLKARASQPPAQLSGDR